MIAKEVVSICPICGGQNIVKNGHNASGNQQYLCKSCGKYSVLESKRGYTLEQKERILSAYNECLSMRGIQRTLGVNRHTVASWIKKEQKQLSY